METRYFETFQKMTTRSVRFGLMAVLSAVVVIFSSAVSSLASAPDTSRRAIAASGALSTKQVKASTFINAFSSVATRVKNKQLPSYVSAAVTLRPDLAGKIVAAALKSHAHGDRPSLDLIARIVQAAIAAAPEAKIAIVRAALGTCPWAREYILAAAQTVGNNIAFFRPPGINGTINPANISTAGQGSIQSPEQPPTP